MEINTLKVGVTNVNIQRTDGRIHSALVTNVSPSSKMVTVEWLERGETKGKEVDLDAVRLLNPELFVQKTVGPLKPKNEEEKMLTDSPCDEVDSSFGKKNENMCTKKSRLIPPRKKAISSISSSLLPKMLVPTTMHRTASTMQTVSHHNSPKIARPSLSQVPNADRLRISPRLSRRTNASSVATTTAAATIPATAEMNGATALGVGTTKSTVPAPVVKTSNTAVGKKKLSCFKAVEKIAKQRHERRITQQALRIQREQSYDTTLPNWEFDAMIREFRSTLDYRPLTNSDAVVDHEICVCVRKRPQNTRELANKEIDVVTIPSKDLLIVHEPKTKVDLTRYVENQQFRFDYTFDENSSNEIVYRYTAKPLVESIFDKGMATCFAYGQTGSGKTHTMGGEFCSKAQQDCSNGIYFLAAQDMFHLLNTKYKTMGLKASASYFEIYSGKVFDLLNAKVKLRILEDGRQQVQIVNLKEEDIANVDDVSRLIQTGSAVRTSGVTSANNHSSRSHAVFQIILRSKMTKKLHGKFSLVDLAGNERGADTFSSDRQTRTEGAEINKSLLALKECIRALGRDSSYVPFRLSRLTHVLRDSFVGAHSRTCMIAMISPGMNSCEHTLNTLRYADRVKELGTSGGTSTTESKAMDMEQSGDGEDLLEIEDDFSLLRRSAEAVSQELLNYHNAVGQTQDQEEELIDSHGLLIQQMAAWRDAHENLLKTTEAIDYDVEEYASELDRLLGEKIELLAAMKVKVGNFRSELANEESLVKNLRMGNS